MDKRTRRVIEQMLASETEKNTFSYEMFVQIPAKRNLFHVVVEIARGPFDYGFFVLKSLYNFSMTLKQQATEVICHTVIL